MKRIFEHPSTPLTGKKYWRSLGQLDDTPEFRGWLEREFPQGAAEIQGGDVTRRNFLKLMGASTALAGLGLSACRRPTMHLVPFTRGVEWSIPGKPLFFHHRPAHAPRLCSAGGDDARRTPHEDRRQPPARGEQGCDG
ncbi:MAG: TAT-variant-translocated molybdopterin oxidoreductase [Chthoniobacter sp.]